MVLLHDSAQGVTSSNSFYWSSLSEKAHSCSTCQLWYHVAFRWNFVGNKINKWSVKAETTVWREGPCFSDMTNITFFLHYPHLLLGLGSDCIMLHGPFMHWHLYIWSVSIHTWSIFAMLSSDLSLFLGFQGLFIYYIEYSQIISNFCVSERLIKYKFWVLSTFLSFSSICLACIWPFVGHLPKEWGAESSHRGRGAAYQTTGESKYRSCWTGQQNKQMLELINTKCWVSLVSSFYFVKSYHVCNTLFIWLHIAHIDVNWSGFAHVNNLCCLH